MRKHMRNMHDNDDMHNFAWNTYIGRISYMLAHAMHVQHHICSLYTCANYAYGFTYMFPFAYSDAGRYCQRIIYFMSQMVK